jgi:AbrB family looped-hinge helix DNA binding protein
VRVYHSAIDPGIISGMKTTIDAAGRLVIPKELRRQAGIQPGMRLDIRVMDGRIEIEPAASEVQLVRQGRFLVAVPEEELPALTSDTVDETLEAVREERATDLSS